MEGYIGEGHEEAYDEEWNEIVEAMDWIQEQVLGGK